MKKITIYVSIILIVTMLLLGCIGGGEDANITEEFKVSNQSEANQAIIDVSTDLSGISNSFDEINENLVD
jgi:PBP1b-binding outer membrane lipoprotein LpoB